MATGLTLKQEAFVAAYIGEANGNATEAARIAGYKLPHPQGAENLQKPTIAARIEEHRATIARKGIAVKQARIDTYAEIHRRLWQVVEERAADPGMAHIPGASGGFVVRTYKIAANGEHVEEYHPDTALQASLDANMKQMAQELGEWEAEGAGVSDSLLRRYIGVNVQVVLGANADS